MSHRRRSRASPACAEGLDEYGRLASLKASAASGAAGARPSPASSAAPILLSEAAATASPSIEEPLMVRAALTVAKLPRDLTRRKLS